MAKKKSVATRKDEHRQAADEQFRREAKEKWAKAEADFARQYPKPTVRQVEDQQKRLTRISEEIGGHKPRQNLLQSTLEIIMAALAYCEQAEQAFRVFPDCPTLHLRIPTIWSKLRLLEADTGARRPAEPTVQSIREYRSALNTAYEWCKDLCFHHSADYRSVTWNGETFEFTATQASIMKALKEAKEGGFIGVHQDELFSVTGSNLATHNKANLRDLFKRAGKMHPAWGTMIVRVRKGTYSLAEPF